MSTVPITYLPEILYIDGHSQVNKFGKQNIAVTPNGHKETNIGGKNHQTNKKPKYKIINNQTNFDPTLEPLKSDVHYFINTVQGNFFSSLS